MQGVLLRVLEVVAVNLVSRIFEQNLKRKRGAPPKVDASEAEARLAKLHAAVTEAFDGTPATPEQKRKLKKRIKEFVQDTDLQ